MSIFENQSNEKPVYKRRRNVLKAIGGGTLLSVTSGVASATSENRDGGTKRLSNSQPPASITNTIRDANDLLDYSTSSGGWEIRNVGFQNYRSSSTPLINPAVTDPGQSAIIDGCYFGDGGAGPALFVDPNHAGELLIRNCYFEGWGDNAVYGSPSGNPSSHPTPGSGGVVKVENCYSRGNAISNFRLGTDGSYVKNCVSVGSQRGYWGFYGSTRVLGCDIFGGIHASDNRWQEPAVVTVENTRFSGQHVHYDGATINGTSQGQPQDRYPGVPLSPTAAKKRNLSR